MAVCLLLLLLLHPVILHAQLNVDAAETPTVDECRVHIEQALKDQAPSPNEDVQLTEATATVEEEESTCEKDPTLGCEPEPDAEAIVQEEEVEELQEEPGDEDVCTDDDKPVDEGEEESGEDQSGEDGGSSEEVNEETKDKSGNEDGEDSDGHSPAGDADSSTPELGEESDGSGEEDKSDGEEQGEAGNDEDATKTDVGDDADQTEDEGETEVEVQEEEEGEGEVTPTSPDNVRSRNHIDSVLGLQDAAAETNEVTTELLRDLKRLYDTSVKPLEQVYKYKDISTRQFGESEIYSTPIILLLGPWQGGKSSIINYLLGTEYTTQAIKTGTAPHGKHFNIIMHGESPETIDGTQLVAHWAFSSLQKFGQAFLDVIQGRRLPNRLLEKVTFVEIPGITEHRKPTVRTYPFNDVCQWFIDRSDLIFIVLDPNKLDIGLEMEALFDQLKGRESQIRILLNKADMIAPEALLKVQAMLFWNLSPILESSDPPEIYAGSFWSSPYRPGAPVRLLQAQEDALLKDIRSTIEMRVENRIAVTRRHAVRVRNHAKMVDTYLSTYYKEKGFFSKRKKVAEKIINNPHEYNIYEGLSTMTNISRYDLPDPEVYRDFFRLHPIYEFQPLSATCTYFKGCPMNRLDIAIAYDLPEMLEKYRKSVEDTKS